MTNLAQKLHQENMQQLSNQVAARREYQNWLNENNLVYRQLKTNSSTVKIYQLCAALRAR
jgi:hypothetical protein